MLSWLPPALKHVGLSLLAAVQGTGPAVTPEAGALGARQPQAPLLMSRQWEPPRGDGALLTGPCCLLLAPSLFLTLHPADPDSPSTHPTSHLLTPARVSSWLSSGTPHRSVPSPSPKSSRLPFPQTISLLHPIPGSPPACHPSLGAMPGTYHQSVPSPRGANRPQQSSGHPVPHHVPHPVPHAWSGSACRAWMACRHQLLGPWPPLSRWGPCEGLQPGGGELCTWAVTFRGKAGISRERSRVRPRRELSTLLVGILGEEPRAPRFLEQAAKRQQSGSEDGAWAQPMLTHCSSTD